MRLPAGPQVQAIVGDQVARVGRGLYRLVPTPRATSDLDPECARAYRLLDLLPLDVTRLPIPIVRPLLELLDLSFNRPANREVRVSEQTVGPDGLRVRIYSPEHERNGAMLYLHGGGGVVGSIGSHDRLCRQVADRGAMTIYSVGYRLAPEHPPPAAVLDVITAFNHVAAQRDRDGESRGPIGIGGDSAGGMLALVATEQAVRPTLPIEMDRVPDYQWLIYPGLDLTLKLAGHVEGGVLLSGSVADWLTGYYTRSQDCADPVLSPGHASDQVIAALPPTMLVSVGVDPLLGQIEAFATRLAAAGVDYARQHESTLPHHFFQLAGVSIRAASFIDESIDTLVRFVNDRFSV